MRYAAKNQYVSSRCVCSMTVLTVIDCWYPSGKTHKLQVEMKLEGFVFLSRISYSPFGTLPAICIQGQMKSAIVPDSITDSDFAFTEEGQQSIGMAAPTESLFTYVGTHLTPDIIERIHNKALRLFVFGRIVYKSPYDVAIADTTEFSQYWDGSGWIEGQSHNAMK